MKTQQERKSLKQTMPIHAIILKLLLVLFIFCGNNAFAQQPTINNVSGTILDGQQITITGSGFTVKANPKPLFWWKADFDKTPSPLGRKTAWDGSDQHITFSTNVVAPGSQKSSRVDHGTSSGVGLSRVDFNSDQLYLYRKTYEDFDITKDYAIRVISTLISGTLNVGDVVTGQTSGATGKIVRLVPKTLPTYLVQYGNTFGTINAQPSVDFVNNEQMISSSGAIITNSEPGGVFRTFNFKTIRFWGPDKASDNSGPNNMHVSAQGRNHNKINITPEYTEGTHWSGNFTNQALYQLPREWKTEEVQYQVSDIDVYNGTFNFYQKGILGTDHKFRNRTSKFPKGYNKVYQSQVSHNAQPGSVMYYDQLYLDDTWHRVVISKSSTWTARGNVEVQIPAQWNDGQIVIQANLGGLDPTTALYLYVVNKDGIANTNGFPLSSGNPIPDFANAEDIANGGVSGLSSIDVGDLNGDGRGDVVTIEGGKHAGNRKTFAWFEAPASIQGSWIRHEFGNSSQLRSFLGSAKVADMDNDGDLDLILSSDNHSGNSKQADLYVYVNPGSNAVNGPWSFHRVTPSTLALHHINDMEIADMDADGKLDIIVRSLEPNQIHIFFQNSISSYTKKTINTNILQSEGLSVGLLDGDNLPDITFTGHWLKSPANPRTQNYTLLNIDSDYKNINQNTKEAIGDIDGDGLNDVIISPAEAFRNGGNTILAWYKNPGNTSSSNWQKNIILNTTNNTHTVKLGDMDNDGDLDVVTGTPWSNSVSTISTKIYYNNGTGVFGAAQIVSSNKGLYSGVVYDIEGDGDLDIIGQNTYANSSRPYVYENFLNSTIPTIPVISVNVSPTSATLTVGSTQQLTKTINPSNASNPVVSWTSSNEAIAEVDVTGLVTANAVGTAIITVTTQDGNKTATATITVQAPLPEVNRDAYTQIEAESYDNQNGLGIYPGGTGQKIGSIHNGEYAVYENVEFVAGASGFEASVSSRTNGGNIEIHLGSVNGTLLGTCTVPGTGGWNNFVDVSCSVTTVGGLHDVYLVFKGGSGFLLDVDYFKFNQTTPPAQYTLTTNANPANLGSVTVNPAGGTYSAGTLVTLTANVNPGSLFNGWNDGETAVTRIILMDGNKNITANFSQVSYLLFAIASGTGSITIDPPQNPTGGIYNFGEQVTLTAIADSGSQFDGWEGDLSGTNPIQTITMDGNKDITANFSVVPSTSGLLGHWPFNGNTNDVSGNNHHATAQNSPSYSAGQVGQGMNTNGSYAKVASDPFDLSTFTLMTWVKPSNISSGWRVIMEKDRFKSDWYGIYQKGNKIHFRWSSNSTTGIMTTSVAALQANTFAHVTATFSNGTAKIYINGELKGTKQGILGAASNSDGELRFGLNGSGNEKFQGVLDEAKIFGTALTAVEIQDEMDVTTTPCNPDSALVAYYSFNSLSNPMSDHSGNNHTATSPTGSPDVTLGVEGTRAIAFNGIDDYLNIGNFNVSGNKLTLSAWIKADGFDTPEARIISKATGVQGYNHTWMLSTINSNGIKPRFRLKTGGTTSVLIGTQTLNTNTWYHLVATYDGSKMRLYVNGVVKGSKNKTGNITTSSANIRIGDNPVGLRRFNGKIDDVRIYNKALSVNEINNLDATECSSGSGTGNGATAGQENAIQLYPNPTTEKVTLELPVTSNGWKYQLVTVSGQVIKKGTFKNTTSTLDLKALTNGIYFLQLTSDQKTEAIKIVKQ